MKDSSAFTLIERLTVIAIIGILAALLLSGLASAKRRAQQAQCVSNLHQLGLGLQGFVADYHTYPLFANVGFSKKEYPEHWRTWIEAMRREGFGSKSNGMPITEGVWHCPSARWGETWRRGETPASYGNNAYGVSSPENRGALGLGAHQLPASGTLAPPVDESEVITPSDMMAMGDSFNGSVVFGRGIGVEEMDKRDKASSRHRGTATVLFCDGHIESPKLKFLFEDTNDVALIRWNRDHQPH